MQEVKTQLSILFIHDISSNIYRNLILFMIATGSKSATEDDSDEDSVSVKLGWYKKDFLQDISSNIYCNFR